MIMHRHAQPLPLGEPDLRPRHGPIVDPGGDALLAKREVKAPNVEQVLLDPARTCGSWRGWSWSLLACGPPSTTAQRQGARPSARQFQELTARHPGGVSPFLHKRLPPSPFFR